MEALKEKRMVRLESGDVFVIQKGVPVTGAYRSLGANFRYPFREMEVGDSFEIRSTKDEARRMVSNLSSACVSYVKRNNVEAKFTVRRTSDTTIRCWRIK